MTFRSFVTPAALALLVFTSPGRAQAPGADAAVKRGKSTWASRGCGSCHGFGKKQAGPDMAGVTKRRSTAWLTRFLQNSDQVLNSDPVGIALVKEWKGVRMPKTALSEADAAAVVAFLAAEDASRTP